MVGGQAHLVKDVPPFVTIDGQSSYVVGLNQVGLRRAGYDARDDPAIERGLSADLPQRPDVAGHPRRLQQEFRRRPGRRILSFPRRDDPRHPSRTPHAARRDDQVAHGRGAGVAAAIAGGMRGKEEGGRMKAEKQPTFILHPSTFILSLTARRPPCKKGKRMGGWLWRYLPCGFWMGPIGDAIFDDVPTPLTIGREEGNPIQLNDERISRFHLKIQEDEGKLVLTDLESTNGTKVNGETRPSLGAPAGRRDRPGPHGDGRSARGKRLPSGWRRSAGRTCPRGSPWRRRSRARPPVRWRWISS